MDYAQAIAKAENPNDDEDVDKTFMWVREVF